MSHGAAPSRVAMLMGGPSAEREVSLSSGRECAAALRAAGYEVIEIDAGADRAALATLGARLSALPKGTPVFNGLHGPWGEDGCVQGLMECLGIPYTHSGVGASALAIDKQRAKTVMAAAGVPVVHSIVTTAAAARAGHPLPPPYVVKPVNEGSSVGVYIVHEDANGPARLADDMPETVMAETYAPGRELTTTVIGAPGEERPLGVTEIHATGWYDYHAKYAPGGSRHTLPADIPAEIRRMCEDLAVRVHRVIGCRSLSRTDFRWDEVRGAEGLIVLEVNTQPGMTPTSLTPEQAAHAGLDFPAFCAMLVEDASCGR